MKILVTILFLSISSVAIAREGVSTKIDPARLQAVSDDIVNTKYTLKTGLESIQRTAVTEHDAGYANLLEKLIVQSNGRPNESLMRNLLQRIQVVYNVLKKAPKTYQRDATMRRVLVEGIEWANELYQPDMNRIRLARENRLDLVFRDVEFATLGVEWAQYMLDLFYEAPTTATKMQLMLDMMGIMYNDILDDDYVNRALAPVAATFANKHEEVEQTPLPEHTKDQMLFALSLRDFMELHLKACRDLLATYQVTIRNRKLQ